MPRYAFRIEYHGAPFSGWQRQADHPSVQAALEAALAKLDAAAPATTAAGRTDAGVHATGQVAHTDMARGWAPFRLMEAVNYHLKPAPVAVTGCASVPDDWSARFSAVKRRYLYRIICRRAPLVLDAGQAWQVKHDLDADAMRKAALHLVGRHDFTTFRASLCQANSPIRTLDSVEVEARPLRHGTEIRLSLRARSFLHNQVRSIAGTLERVGAGAWSPGTVADVLAARDRARCGPVAPAHGLCLTAVSYPADPFA